MKKSLFLSLTMGLLLSFFACQKHDGFLIKGTISGMNEGWVNISKYSAGNAVAVDSAQVKNGTFQLKGKVEMPELYYLSIQGAEGVIPFFIENATITMNIKKENLAQSDIKGSATHDTYKNFFADQEKAAEKYKDLYQQYETAHSTNDATKMAAVENEIEKLQNEDLQKTKEFIVKNNKSIVSPYLAMTNIYSFSFEELQKINQSFDPSIAKSPFVQQLKDRENTLAKVQIGQQAPDFKMADPTGKEIALSDLKGKVVLVDFWASWCKPCRAENPNVVAAYKKFAPKGFTVFGVSFDENKEKWIEAIKKDGLTWTNVSDLKGWQNAAGKIYGIMSVPSSVLLDKEGKIIGRDLRGEDLTKKLEETFAQPKK